MKTKEVITAALLIPILSLHITLIWIITGPVTFMDRVIVIILACGMILLFIIKLFIITIICTLSKHELNK